jgi:simple sugar transport system ATP-binding protein
MFQKMFLHDRHGLTAGRPRASARGLGVIFITHNVRHAYAVGDRFTILNRGRTLGTFAKAEIKLDALQQMMAGDKELQELSDELGGTV